MAFLRKGETSLNIIYPYVAGRALLDEEIPKVLAGAKLTLSAEELSQCYAELKEAKLVQQTLAVHYSPWAIRRHCKRCGAGPKYIEVSKCASCGQSHCAYCTNCLHLGRAKSCKTLSLFQPMQQTDMEIEEQYFPLLPAGQKTVDKLCSWLASSVPAMTLMIVPGAGKIMTLCPVIQTLLLAGKRIYWCRKRDQVEELMRRLTLLLPDVVAVDWNRSSGVTVGTRDALWRYYEQFDLIIFDGIEPLGTGMFHTPLTPNGKFLTVTASFPKRHVDELIIHSTRRNNESLPEPFIVRKRKWWRMLKQKKSISELLEFFKIVEQTNGQAYFIMPHESELEIMEDWLQSVLPSVANETGVLTEEDDHLISLFQDKKLRYLLLPYSLLTPMRIKKLHVCVLGADHPSFHRSDLVQISYHVGKISSGQVWFFSEERTEMMLQAKRELKYLIELNQKEGYLQKEA